MATHKPRLTVNVTEEQLNNIDIAVADMGMISRSAFVSKAIDYYLATMTYDKNQKKFVTSEMSEEIKKSLTPIKNNSDEQIRNLSILLNSIWRKLNNPKPNLTDDELVALVKNARNDIDSDGGLSPVMIVNAAQSEIHGNENQTIENPFKQDTVTPTPPPQKDTAYERGHSPSSAFFKSRQEPENPNIYQNNNSQNEQREYDEPRFSDTGRGWQMPDK